jgi:predicted dehydrogenase
MVGGEMTPQNSEAIGVAVIGTGDIANAYIQDLLTYPEMKVIGVSDLDVAKARAFGEKYGIHAFENTQTLLADDRVQVVVNLTSHFAHKTVTEQALKAGKHVYSEKPLALESAEAWDLVSLAEERQLRLACSPFTMIGEAQQTAWKLIREGKLGMVRVVYGEANWGRIESWHPAPVPFYQVGAMFDVGVYILGLVTSFFGPARRILSYGRILVPDRFTKDGQPYTLTTPDWMVSLIEMESGVQVRLTSNFYVSNESTRQTGLEFHGDEGSLHLESFFMPNSALSFARFSETLQPVELVRPAPMEITWGRGVLELVQAIQEERPHRFGAEQAAHITDILAASKASLETGYPVDIHSRFPVPMPAPWAV